MTREDLAREVALRTGLSRRDAGAVLDCILRVMEEKLCEGESIYLRGFGCFEAKPACRRRARDPRGEGLIDIPPRMRPVFRPYNRLRDAVHASLSPSARAVFVFPGGASASRVSVVGGFNNWDETANPMQRLPDGSWITEVMLPAGQIITYRFLVDGVPTPDPSCPRDRSGNSVRSV